ASHEPRKETPGSLFAFFAMALVDPLIPLTRDAVNCDPFSKPYLSILFYHSKKNHRIKPRKSLCPAPAEASCGFPLQSRLTRIFSRLMEIIELFAS
ncbi:hypothetical protein N0M98_33600, partial [Paenibacillus doosanensis]|uniref:hypothetical protein n=1 Tax=Paenibacillus doosanensis TaxID=1229154 RepID=UPI0021804043